ncbi:MAG: hypothetical protein LH645_07695 [Actinomycetia bacterium]|nr:hypothetical protein [Actinomycetes bacterium]
MSVRRSAIALAVVATVGASALVAPGASAQLPGPWGTPKRIPGSAGLVNPVSAVAADGTDLVTWLVDGSGTFGNAVLGKVRLPGETEWKRVPVGPDGSFLGVTDIAPTASGDFWMTYQTGAGNYTSYLIKLDAQTRRWSEPVRLFKDQDNHFHASSEIAITADGTLVVTAVSPPKVDPPGDPVARLSVGIHSPGGTWQNRFLTPADKFANAQHLAVNPAGDVVISFIQGYNLPDMTVRAATKAKGKNSEWKVSTISTAGDSQRVHPTIGVDGTAAVVWTATSQTFDAVRMATREVRRPLAPWVARDVVSGSLVSTDAYGVVNRQSETTAVWGQRSGGTLTIWSRHLDDSGLGGAVQLTPTGEYAELNALVQRPDGKAALLYQRFTPAFDGLAVEFRTLSQGVPGPVQQLFGDEATNGASNGEVIGVDARSHGTMIYTRGTYPDTDFAWLGQSQGPSIMTSPTSGSVVNRARVAGSLRIGTRATCASGYWVETSSISYRWERNGNRIRGATAKKYRLVSRDDGEKVSCEATGADSTGQTRVLNSPSRRAG